VVEFPILHPAAIQTNPKMAATYSDARVAHDVPTEHQSLFETRIMPMLVRTPEEIIRTTGQGIYLIRFKEELDGFGGWPNPAGKDELVEWFKTHQPHVQLELIGPSEFSGMICGGIGNDWYIANWTEEDVVTFSAAWEKEDGGSVDARFQCFSYPVYEYERRLTEKGDPRELEDW
jgi:hypothetical protein